MKLPQAAVYFPIKSTTFSLTPGLFAFATDFGNADLDRCLFQFDHQFAEYRAAKLAAREENLAKYYPPASIRPSLRTELTRLIVQQLLQCWPDYFVQTESSTGICIQCTLTGEDLCFDRDYGFAAGASNCRGDYRDGLDALASQLQEDFAVVELNEQGRDTISLIHLCFPNHWAAQDKINHGFSEIHEPVADFDKMHKQSEVLVRTMIDKGPYVRFAWGLASDTRLNHHPQPPADDSNKPVQALESEQWRGRQFDREEAAVYLRVERQVTWGMPDQRAALFTIRTYFYDIRTLSCDQRHKIAESVRSMSAQMLRYKGLAQQKDSLIAWLLS